MGTRKKMSLTQKIVAFLGLCAAAAKAQELSCINAGRVDSKGVPIPYSCIFSQVIMNAEGELIRLDRDYLVCEDRQPEAINALVFPINCVYVAMNRLLIAWASQASFSVKDEKDLGHVVFARSTEQEKTFQGSHESADFAKCQAPSFCAYSKANDWFEDHLAIFPVEKEMVEIGFGIFRDTQSRGRRFDVNELAPRAASRRPNSPAA